MMRAFLGLSMAFAISQFANADTAYVKPSTFTPVLDQTITVEVAFNDVCCEPRYAVRSDTYVMISSDGGAQRPDRLETYATTTMLEHKISALGTMRISTGERLGRKGEYVKIAGRYHLVNSPDAELKEIPDGTSILTSQTATVSDAYITIGDKDWGAISHTIGRLAIEPLEHPNNAETRTPFQGRVTFDGKPIAKQAVILTTEMQRLTGSDEARATTDDAGIFSLSFDDPGIHLIMVRLQAPAPKGSETDIRSYTTSLTLDVRAADDVS